MLSLDVFMENKIKVLFLIQKFDTKKLHDSAGYNEIAQPFIQSGLINQHHIFSWGLGEHYIRQYLAEQCSIIKSLVGKQPVTVYGAGAHTQGIWSDLLQLNIVSIADKQVEKIGQCFLDMPIVSPDDISTDVIVISSRAWEEDILNDLRTKYPEKKIFPLYRDLQEKISSENTKQIAALEEEVNLSDFDLIFYTPAEPAEALTETQLKKLKEKSNARLLSVWWDYDDSSIDNVYMAFEKASLACVDMIIDPGNFGKTQKMKKGEPPYHFHRDVNKVALLPTPVDETIFYPRKKTIDVAIFGSDVGLRRKWIDLLCKNYSDTFRHIGGVGIGRVAIPMAEYARLSGECKIIVNSQTYSFRSQCKGKVREALASGSLLLEEDCYESRCFFEGTNFVQFYKTESELLGLLNYFLTHDNERIELATQGYQWYLKNWSSAIWTKKVFDFLDLQLPFNASGELNL
ncbi:MAG: glycosyltransferase family 1 protein [Colwellia sp.]|nr:glycosyltransferase family 1 protein [Colwellia sp.]